MTVIPDWTGQEDDTYWASTQIGLELDMKRLPLCPRQTKDLLIDMDLDGGGGNQKYLYIFIIYNYYGFAVLI